MPEFSVRELRCLETRYRTTADLSLIEANLPPISEGFRRRAIEARMKEDGIADVIILDVESGFFLGPMSALE